MEKRDDGSGIRCNEHPDAPHGFMRDASHSAGRYVCECESWEPPKNKPMTRDEWKEWLAKSWDEAQATGRESAVELRRLHEVNQDLLKALNTILNICLIDNGHWAKTIEREAHEAIAKAIGGRA